MSASLGIVIVAGGSSSRFGGGNKLLQPLNGKPVIWHTLKALHNPDWPVVLVVPQSQREDFQVIAAEFGNGVTLTNGGSCRSESVLHGLEALDAYEPEFVAIHDGARPFVTAELLTQCLADAAAYDGASCAAHPVTDTIHLADGDGFVAATPDRSALWAAETPQVFRASLLKRAYAEVDWAANPPTDEVALVSMLPGVKIRLVHNSVPNPKITYRHDLTNYQA